MPVVYAALRHGETDSGKQNPKAIQNLAPRGWASAFKDQECWETECTHVSSQRRHQLLPDRWFETGDRVIGPQRVTSHPGAVSKASQSGLPDG